MTENITNIYPEAIKAIKQAILQSRYRIAAMANREMLSLYFGIGEYISKHSRKGFWGTNAIALISEQLQKELPGLRGFSETNLKRMRQFYETWATEFRPLVTDDLQICENESVVICPMTSDEFSADILNCFVSVGFSHHYEIINKTSSREERIFYIQYSATNFWSYEKLRYDLKSNLYQQQGSIINNFVQTISENDFRGKALQSFKDLYLLDFVNIEDPDEEDEREIENQMGVATYKTARELPPEYKGILPDADSLKKLLDK